MSGSAMAAAVVDSMKPDNPKITGAAEADLKAKLAPYFQAVIDYLVANAVITGTAGGDPIVDGKIT